MLGGDREAEGLKEKKCEKLGIAIGDVGNISIVDIHKGEERTTHRMKVIFLTCLAKAVVRVFIKS